MPESHAVLTYRFGRVVDSVITPVEIRAEPGDAAHGCAANALWDTGAMLSAVSHTVADQLNLNVIDTMDIIGINNKVISVDKSLVSVVFPNKTMIQDLCVAVCDFSPGIDIILGMDAITQMDFALCNGGGETLFSFALPPFDEKIDFTERA